MDEIQYLPYVSLTFALLALYFSVRAIRGVEVALKRSDNNRIAELEEAVDNLEGDLHRERKKWKRLNANYASLMSGGRNQYTDDEDPQKPTKSLDTGRRPDETYAQHKERLRRYVRDGRITHGQDAYPGG